MEINGQCHCGDLRLLLEWPGNPDKLPARACQCTYCTRFGGNWTSHPDASVELTAANESRLIRYQFGTRTAEFIACARCGVHVIATYNNGERDYAVVSVNVLSDVPGSGFQQAETNFDAEALADRLARREKNWIPRVKISFTDSG